MSEKKPNIKRVGNVDMTVKGYNPEKPNDDLYMWHDPIEEKVPHEDIDTDDLRKHINRHRNSSYKKN